LRDCGFGKVMNQRVVMHAEAKRNPTKGRQRYIVAGHIELLKAVPLLELAEAVSLLVAVRKVVVNQIGDPPLRAESNGLRNQRICRSLVFVLNQREDMHQVGLGSGFVAHQLNETNHGVAEECTDEDTPIKKRASVPARFLK